MSQTVDNDWRYFLLKLEHWGRAGRGLHGPKSLGRPGADAERLPVWSPDDSTMESLITGPLQKQHGERRVQALVLYYVLGKGDVGSAASMRIDAESFARFRAETERLLHDFWLTRENLQCK